MSTTMTAAQLVEPGRFELVRLPMPAPGAGEVRVSLEGCGVCASNLPAWSGRPWFDYPLAPGELGHEGWGRIAALGPDVDSSLLGRRVGMISERAYADAEIVPADDLVMLPDVLPMAPLEPFGCVFNVARRAAFGGGDTVAVAGLGFIGLGVARLAAQAGARVIAISRNAEALETASGFGAAHAIPQSDRGAMAAAVGEITSGAGCDVVIECTGHQEPLDLAGDLVRFGGRLVIAGFHQDGPRQVDLQQWNWKGIDVVNAHERSVERIRWGMRTAARAIGRDPTWVSGLVTHTFPLGEIGEALQHAASRPPGFIKAAVLTGAGP